eukprot:261499-Prorocentrum_minimum.AAC.1
MEVFKAHQEQYAIFAAMLPPRTETEQYAIFAAMLPPRTETYWAVAHRPRLFATYSKIRESTFGH